MSLLQEKACNRNVGYRYLFSSLQRKTVYKKTRPKTFGIPVSFFFIADKFHDFDVFARLFSDVEYFGAKNGRFYLAIIVAVVNKAPF